MFRAIQEPVQGLRRESVERPGREQVQVAHRGLEQGSGPPQAQAELPGLA